MVEDNPNRSKDDPSPENSDELEDIESQTNADLPETTVQEAVRLTRLARDAVDKQEADVYRSDRDDRLAEYEYLARLRVEESDEILVLYPAEWIDDGTIAFDRIEHTNRAIERPISGVGEENKFEQIDTHNRSVVNQVEEKAGSIHAENAAAFADFMGNYYVRRVETATEAELTEFREEYFPRNAFPTDEQRDAHEESLRLVFKIAENDPPPSLSRDS